MISTHTERDLSLSERIELLIAGKLDGDEARRIGWTLIEQGANAYSQGESYRRNRIEARDLTRGYHWQDTVRNADTGQEQSEKEYLEGQGRVPVVMNLAGNIINNVEGQFRQNKSGRLAYAVEADDSDAVEMINLARRAVRRYNDSEMIEADNFREHVSAGAAAFKSTIVWDARLNRHEVKDSVVDVMRLFFNRDIKDRRFNGLRIIGEIHDVPIEDVIARFAKNKSDVARIRDLYESRRDDDQMHSDVFDFDAHSGLSFLSPMSPNLCRVVEIWKPVYKWTRRGFDPLFEHMPEGFGQTSLSDAQISRIQNKRRADYDAGMYPGFPSAPIMELDEPRYEPVFHYFFLTPFGDVLKAGESPYRHQEHPYTPGLALLVDGETWGIMNMVRDMQRWVNRILVHIDAQLSSGGQGLLVLDDDVLEQSGLSADDVASEYNDPRGVLSLKKGRTSFDSAIKQLQGRGIQPGWTEMLSVMVDSIRQTSGVQGASLGEKPDSGTPATLYQQQVLQSSLSVLPFMQTYFETLRRKDRKEIQLILQSFTEKRMYSPEGGGSRVFDPSRIVGMDFDVAIGDVTDTTVYRQLWEGDLQNFLNNGFFGPPGPQALAVYLKASQHPQAETLLALLQGTGDEGGMGAFMAQPQQAQTQ